MSKPNITHRPRVALALALLLMLALPAPMNLAQVDSRQSDAQEPEMRDFHLLSPTEGWLLLGDHLYWTVTGGSTWADITPPGCAQCTIQAVTFVSAQGWVVLTQGAQPISPTYTLARTSDGGRTWRTSVLSLFEPGEPESLPGAVYLYFLDPRAGWLVVRQATSSNFRVGSLFRTTDGGDTWTQLKIPIGEPVYFVTRYLGWTAGGVGGGQLYSTQDGGQTWQPQAMGATQGRVQRLCYLPHFNSLATGTLPVIKVSDGSSRLELYSTSDGGQSWALSTTALLEPAVTPGQVVTLSAAGSHSWLVATPGSPEVVRVSDGGDTNVIDRSIPLGTGIVELDMVTADVGWAKSISGSCANLNPQEDDATPAAGGTVCQQSVALVRTGDAAKSWSTLPLPEVGLHKIVTADSAAATSKPSPSASLPGLTSQTEPWIGQGFDKCEIPTLGDLQTWKTNSPYGAVNLYIGGSCRGCPNSGLTADWVAQAAQQGWKFIPTWVGLQSACWSSPYCDRISNDPSTAYNQGLAEADAAKAVAVSLGLAQPDGSGTIIYYDLEGYGGADPTCRAAAQAFISGWTARLHGYGSLSGVYGSSCSSAISDFAYIENVPDAVWPAHWIYSYYDPNATVWGVACLSDGLWANHERIRQYAGGHYETWGGITFNIDCNVVDGVVAGVGASGCCACGKLATAGKTKAWAAALPTAPSSAQATEPQPTLLVSHPAPALTRPPDAPAPAPALSFQPLSAEETVQTAPYKAVDPLRVPPGSASYLIPKAVFGTGGGPKSSTHFRMDGTQGQSTDLNRHQSANYVLMPGYWGPWAPISFGYGVYLPLVVRNR